LKNVRGRLAATGIGRRRDGNSDCCDSAPAQERAGTGSGRSPDLSSRKHESEETNMSLGTILLIILILALIGVLPTWPHSRAWGYGPVGGVGLVVVILVVLLLMGRI
jgi:hypothetical protein